MEERYAQAEAMAICKALYDKKAQDIRAMYVQDKTVVADWFILCSGRSVPQVKTLCDDLEEKMAETGYFVRRKEGYRGGPLGRSGLWRCSGTCISSGRAHLL